MGKSSLGVIPVYSYRRAKCLKFNALVAHPVHVVWLDFTAKPKRYSAGHGYTLLRFCPVRNAEDETEDVQGKAEMYDFWK